MSIVRDMVTKFLFSMRKIVFNSDLGCIGLNWGLNWFGWLWILGYLKILIVSLYMPKWNLVILLTKTLDIMKENSVSPTNF